jgi:hypothetical protein
MPEIFLIPKPNDLIVIIQGAAIIHLRRFQILFYLNTAWNYCLTYNFIQGS